MVDFTNCEIVLGRMYNGANGSKIAIRYNDSIYMLKFPPSGAGKKTELSYTNSCISEHIGCRIFNLLGVQAQNTILGTFSVKGKEKIVCACEDFATGGKRLFDFCSLKNTILDSESNGNGMELEDILDTIERQEYVSPVALKEHFWNMFVVDALLGNFDRHNGNWGFLYSDIDGAAEIAPVFDCGSCLLPQANEAIMRNVLTNENELNARVFQFPLSAIRHNGQKINYHDFLCNTPDKDVCKALKHIVPKVNLDKICDFIEDIPQIPDIQKQFYEKYIRARYNLILRPALELATL